MRYKIVERLHRGAWHSRGQKRKDVIMQGSMLSPYPMLLCESKDGETQYVIFILQ